MNTKLITYKIDSLLAKSPSILRIGTAVMPLRIISIILAPVTFIVGIILIIAAFAFFDIINQIKTNGSSISDNTLEQEAINKILESFLKDFEFYAMLLLIGGIGVFISGILLFIIAWLTKLIKNRNSFIAETKNVLTGIKADAAE